MGEVKQSFTSAVMGELSRRKVLRTLGAYAVGVFVVLQLLDALSEALRLPGWLPSVLVIAMILGFPLVLILAWQFDITGEGITRTESAGLLSSGQTFSLFAVMLGLTAGLGYGFYAYYGDLFQEEMAPARLAEQVEARDFSAPENSIAVLPFTDLSADQDQAYLSDGMAEEILNILAQVEGLQVAARTSSFAFRDSDTDIREVGRALNVRTVLEGSLRTSGNRVRLTAQLINVDDGYHIWSRTFEEELNDVFKVQDDVAKAIAAELLESFTGLATETPATRPQNLAAFEAYRNGRQHWWKRTPDELTLAIRLFAEALEHDSNYAPAYAAIADSYILLSLYGNSNYLRAIERAQPMIEKALALDPQSAEAWAAQGLARMQIGQLEAAESNLLKAIGFNDSYVPARLWLSNVYAETGELDKQFEVLSGAMAVDPLNELLAINYADNLSKRGDYEGASDVLASQLLFKPNATTLLRSDGQIALSHGELVKGYQQAKRAFDLEPLTPTAFQSLAQAWFTLGDMGQAEELILQGMEVAGGNMDLKQQYFHVLLVQGRLEEAQGLIRDMFGDDIEALPKSFQRTYHFLQGLVNLVGDELKVALTEFELAIKPESSEAFDGNQIFSLLAAASLQQYIGDPERSEAHLAQASRALGTAREKGMRSPDIDYNEALLKLLRDDDREGAMASLREAYNKGWREAWVLKIDSRLAPLYEMPEFIELRETIEADLQRARNEVEALTLSMR